MTSDARHYHPPVEEYLATIHELQERGVTVIQARLAERIGHAPPTVSEMVKRLERDGYLRFDGRQILLTPLGCETANRVVRKHRLAERLLTDIIGVPWHLAHEEAARWEHVISDTVADRIDALLNYPATCPHGNPLPGRAVDLSEAVTLSSLVPGDAFTLVQVPEQLESEHELMEYLFSCGLATGTPATVVAIDPTESDVHVTRGSGSQKRTIVLPFEVADVLIVRRTPDVGTEPDCRT